MLLKVLVPTWGLLSLVTARPPSHAQVISHHSELRDAYDFVIIGGGTSGLTVADRLTEDPNTTVLVLEYGPFDNQNASVLIPGFLNPYEVPYWFDVFTVPQPHLNNGTFRVPAPAVVGGGSVINGMFFDRASSADYDVWEKLGNRGWGWTGLLPYFKKSETFTPPQKEFANAWPELSWDSSVHGKNGSVQASYPVYQFPIIKNYFEAFDSLGVGTPKDPAGGHATGVFWGPSSLDPRNETRSYARTAHYDGVAWRPNYHLLTESAVKRIIFNGTVAVGVEYIARSTNTTHSVLAAKEIVLSAGSVRSPQVLQASGIGPKWLSDNLGIQSVVDLPGVGQNLQDHPTIFVAFDFKSPLYPNTDELTTNETYIAEQQAAYFANRTGAYTITRLSGNTVAFLALPEITPDYDEIIAFANNRSSSSAYSTSVDPTVLAGYNKQRSLILSLYASNLSAVQETGFSGTTLPVTLVKPLSRGTITINTTDINSPPVVDYGTLNDPTDLETIIAALRFNRAMMATPPMQKLQPTELSPGANITTDEQLRDALRSLIQPTYQHPCCTCAMMPRELGGVVDSELRVHGMERLTVVDASVMPMIPATHTSSTVYAIAEKAADILKARHRIKGI